MSTWAWIGIWTGALVLYVGFGILLAWIINRFTEGDVDGDTGFCNFIVFGWPLAIVLLVVVGTATGLGYLFGTNGLVRLLRHSRERRLEKKRERELVRNILNPAPDQPHVPAIRTLPYITHPSDEQRIETPPVTMTGGVFMLGSNAVESSEPWPRPRLSSPPPRNAPWAVTDTIEPVEEPESEPEDGDLII